MLDTAVPGSHHDDAAADEPPKAAHHPPLNQQRRTSQGVSAVKQQELVAEPAAPHTARGRRAPHESVSTVGYAGSTARLPQVQTAPPPQRRQQRSDPPASAAFSARCSSCEGNALHTTFPVAVAGSGRVGSGRVAADDAPPLALALALAPALDDQANVMTVAFWELTLSWKPTKGAPVMGCIARQV